ncbi:hypothetical protein BRADI_1g50446v3 [Brachypodium distachyon]|uniref:Uncharacterized protein n=1 Tax=Brachypodium distachyon TaxID=15368 RepID=A0A2K2DQR4_BRADI|nr:hypothetical protein BRADI_1g50446v3 [Brachypodium distachyon]
MDACCRRRLGGRTSGVWTSAIRRFQGAAGEGSRGVGATGPLDLGRLAGTAAAPSHRTKEGGGAGNHRSGGGGQGR